MPTACCFMDKSDGVPVIREIFGSEFQIMNSEPTAHSNGCPNAMAIECRAGHLGFSGMHDCRTWKGTPRDCRDCGKSGEHWYYFWSNKPAHRMPIEYKGVCRLIENGLGELLQDGDDGFTYVFPAGEDNGNVYKVAGVVRAKRR